MPRGGPRPGAGRTKGKINRVSAAVREAVIASGAETPLAYMLRIMGDRTCDNDRRDDMAKAAAPYMHCRLAAMEHSGPDGGPIEHRDITGLSDAELEAIAAGKAP